MLFAHLFLKIAHVCCFSYWGAWCRVKM